MIRLTSSAPANIRTDLLLIPVWQDPTGHWNVRLAEWVQKAVGYSEFSGKEGESLLHYEWEGAAAPRVMFYGLGRPDCGALEKLRQAAGDGVGQAVKLKLSRLAIVTPEIDALDHPESEIVEALSEGAVLAVPVPNRYKNDADRNVSPGSIQIVIPSSKPSRHKQVLRRVESIGAATLIARQWVNTPSNDKRPESFAQEVAKKASKAELRVEVIKGRQLQRLNMGALMAVGAGSGSRPALVVLEHTPRESAGTVVLVGKGITFDTGGYNIKASGSMESMKVDMAGAAAVAATLIASASLDLGFRLIGVLPLAENMVSGDAYRPGDVIQIYGGKTVEIGNTDAEGRLILADALAYSSRQFQPDVMIDLATLTGACVVALGESLAGVFSPDAELSAQLQAAGERVHERCWPLPLPEDYRSLLKSEIADLRNIGPNRWGGAIVAALFLSEFTGDARWAHIDIAGPAEAKKPTAYCGAGGTGFGVRLLCRFLSSLRFDK
ncbi:MAG: leucyl aminopeptidase [Desulfobacterales bacterium]